MSYEENHNDYGRLPTLTHHQHVKLAKRIAAGDKRAREQMILANVGLVGKAIRAITDGQRGDLTYNDMLQIGMYGLIRAVELWDYRKNLKFSTYAYGGIVRAIARESRYGYSIVRSTSRVALSDHAFAMRNVMEDLLGRRPTDEELADVLEVPAPDVASLLRHTDFVFLSLRYSPFAGANSLTLGDVTDNGSESTEDIVTAKVEFEAYRPHLDVLSEMQRRVIEGRFLQGHSLESMGKELDKTRLEVRIIERDAMQKIRESIKEAA